MSRAQSSSGQETTEEKKNFSNGNNNRRNAINHRKRLYFKQIANNSRMLCCNVRLTRTGLMGLADERKSSMGK